jgi:hypothetical protein
MKVRIGNNTEIGLIGERNVEQNAEHFALLGLGWHWCRGYYAYLSIYFLIWRVELYVDYEKIEDKWKRDELDDLIDLTDSVDKVFNKMKVEEV